MAKYQNTQKLFFLVRNKLLVSLSEWQCANNLVCFFFYVHGVTGRLFLRSGNAKQRRRLSRSVYPGKHFWCDVSRGEGWNMFGCNLKLHLRSSEQAFIYLFIILIIILFIHVLYIEVLIIIITWLIPGKFNKKYWKKEKRTVICKCG